MHNRSLVAALVAACFVAPLSARAQSSPPSKITVCKDGTTTTSVGAGTCSGHGGVDKDATKLKNAKTGADKVGAATEIAAQNTGKAVSKGAEDVGKTAKGASTEAVGDHTSVSADGATAKCKDGTYSHATHEQGTCAKHGGVAIWIHKPTP